MIQQELLDLLQCPETKSPLRAADVSLMAKINEAIAAGTIKNRVGDTVETPLSGGLVTEGGNLLYPIVDDLPVMLVDEAIPLNNSSRPEPTWPRRSSRRLSTKRFLPKSSTKTICVLPSRTSTRRRPSIWS